MRRSIGQSGIEVRAIGLGGMPLSIPGRPDPDRALAVIARFVELGGDFIDSANVYCLNDTDVGHNERLIAAALAKLGSAGAAVTVATKGGLRRPRGQWLTDGRPEVLRRSCEQSLRDLGTARIRLYQLHAVDDRVPLEESVGELIRLKAEGKIAHIGLSNVSRAEVDRALTLTPIVAVQNGCNLFEQRDVASGLVRYCAEREIAFLPHSPVGGHSGHARLAQQRIVKQIAAAHGVSPYRVALAWLLQLGSHVIPIPGATRLASVEDSLRADTLALHAADIALLDDLHA